MQYTRLGKSDLLVSRICMGCMGFGDPSTGQHSWTLDETKSSCRWRGKRSKSSTKSGGNSVSGRNLPAACSDGDHGAKYAANERC